ncbi:TPA: OmpH family outer membrane protein [Candidatus Avigastranaerophilus faecigallinarum]|nr:OmpH family outer membrane protein [Candidatus Avigastranaerophilus faecigallinarum]
MFKIKFILTALLIIFAANLSANAGTIGYADFQKVINEYSYAKNAYKDIDNKLVELQEYAISKDKQYKTIESPIQKKTFEEQIQKEFRAKEERIYNLKTQKEKTIRDNILAACKSVAAAKKLDVILDYGVVYAGGVDVTNDIIQYLNTQKK